MLSMKVLIQFLDRGFVLKVLFLIMLCSLLPVADIFLLLYIRDYIGIYLLVALVASTGLLGLLFAYQQIRAILQALRTSVDDGRYPRMEFMNLAGALVASLLLLTPGFVTDLLGILLFLPLLRVFVGRSVNRRMEGRLKELYEYLKLYDL